MQNQTRRSTERNGPIATTADDYLIVGRDEPERPGFGTRIAYGLLFLIILVIAVLSFATFWVAALLLNIF